MIGLMGDARLRVSVATALRNGGQIKTTLRLRRYVVIADKKWSWSDGRTLPTFIQCHVNAFEYLGGVPGRWRV